jgi:hypothetical protein
MIKCRVYYQNKNFWIEDVERTFYRVIVNNSNTTYYLKNGKLKGKITNNHFKSNDFEIKLSDIDFLYVDDVEND